jgi:hypothetical protein
MSAGISSIIELFLKEISSATQLSACRTGYSHTLLQFGLGQEKTLV